MTAVFEQFREIIANKQTFVITSHINPDGDSIGSETALALALQNMGKTVSIINQSETPDNLRFLSDEVFPVSTFESSVHSAIIRGADCIIVTDTNAPNRFFEMAADVMQSAAYKVCIDHHLEPEHFADIYIIDADSPATSEILYGLIRSLGANAITPEIAKALYTGIMTDTGSFRFPKTDAETHTITADLLRLGADPSEIYQKVYDSGPVNKLQLLGRALDSLTSSSGGALAWMVIRSGDFTETNTVAADTDNFINYTLSVGGVKIGLLFTELDGVVKVSFRSKGEIAINRLAKEFGGNGHKHAAGARIANRTLDDVVGHVTERAKTYL
ncbi:MAG TPA: bifunctional oligoribonuclease/PAP phosphatase NrnA [Bacteroidota bacterium]|nr:bifunctional oligoribonuclease/PAP phosphatase NrnA [Bacteroidota bacterium]